MGRLMQDSKAKKLFEESNSQRRWFEKNYKDILKEYKDKFVAVVGEEIVDCDEDFDALVERVRTRFGKDTTHMIEYVSEERLSFIL